jgi:hypothetical protein
MNVLNATNNLYVKYKGAQDQFINSLLENNITNLSSEFNKKYPETENKSYITHFDKLDYEVKELKYCDKTLYFRYNLLKTCNYINDIKLAICNETKLELLESVSLEINGMMLNKIYFDKYQNQMLDLFDQNSNTNIVQNFDQCFDQNMSFISLSLFDMIPLNEKLDVSISIKFNSSNIIDINNFLLYGNKINLIEQTDSNLDTETIISQIQFTGEESIQNGTNQYRLNFNHPVLMLYFYGIEKEKILNVCLKFDDNVVFNKTIYELEELKLKNGINTDCFVITFSDEFDLKNLFYNKTINFSIIDNAKLIINTKLASDNEKNNELNQTQSTMKIHALNLNTLRITENGCGLRFSK